MHEPVAQQRRAVKRRTVEPKRPTSEPAVTWTSAPAVDEPLQPRRRRAGSAGQRSGWASRTRWPRRVQVEHRRLEAADARRERALDEQLRAAAERQRAQRRRRRGRPSRDIAISPPGSTSSGISAARERRVAAPRARPRRAPGRCRRSCVDVRRRERSSACPAATAARASSSDPSSVGGPVVDAREDVGSAGRSRARFTYDRATHVQLDRGGHGRIRDGAARRSGRRPSWPRQVGARSASSARTSRCPARGCARRSARSRRTWSGWSTRARTSRRRSQEAAESVEGAGVEVETYAREGDPADAILDVAEETQRRPDRGRQQGHDRRQALPARLGAEQGLPPRALQRADHPDDVGAAQRRSTARAASTQARAVARVGAGRAEVARRRLQPRLDLRRASGRGRARRRRSPARRSRTRAARPSTCPT